jgi:hypothetical protein
MVWAAVCGNVAAVEKLLNVNDGGAPSEEQEEKVSPPESVDLDASQKNGAVHVDPAQSGNNYRGNPSEKRENGGADAAQDENEVANDGGTPSEKQQEKNGEEATPPDEGDSDDGGGAANEELMKGGIDKEEILQPLHAAASVGSEKVCTTLINAGAKVCCTSRCRIS